MHIKNIVLFVTVEQRRRKDLLWMGKIQRSPIDPYLFCNTKLQLVDKHQTINNCLAQSFCNAVVLAIANLTEINVDNSPSSNDDGS